TARAPLPSALLEALTVVLWVPSKAGVSYRRRPIQAQPAPGHLRIPFQSALTVSCLPSAGYTSRIATLNCKETDCGSRNFVEAGNDRVVMWWLWMVSRPHAQPSLHSGAA